MFDALMFLAGTVLFFLAVLFFIYNWWERSTVNKRHAALTGDRQAMLEKNVELEIWQKELQVWHDTLETEQQQLEAEREAFRMLVASQDAMENHVLSAPAASAVLDDEAVLKKDRWGKNLKQHGRGPKKQEGVLDQKLENRESGGLW